MKLSDTQLIILSSASQREDRLIVLPEKLKGGAAKAAVSKLLTLGLLREVRVKHDQPSWRTDKDDRPTGLKLTKAGSGAIQVEDEGGEEQEPAQPNRSGRKQPTEPGEPRAGSKQAKIIGLMKRKSGATLDDLVEATGWLPHTTRAALTGLRKKVYEIAKSKDQQGRTVYRIGMMDGRRAERAS